MARITDSFANVASDVARNGDLLTVQMDRLRLIDNPDGRLGVNVCKRISASLTAAGLSHYPNPLPNYSNQSCRLFPAGSKIDMVLTALEDPHQDRVLRDFNAGGNSDAVALGKIRDIIKGLEDEEA